MAISDETGPDTSITELTPALKLFTDRREAIRLFSEYLNDDPPRERILFFYGDGGNGKTLLLNYLHDHYCKRLRRDNWEFVKASADEDFSEHIRETEGADPVPSTLVDFGMAVSDYRPQDAFSALLMMRRALAGHGLHFPLFDFACIWYLHKSGHLTEEKRETLFPPEELDLIAELTDAIGKTSWGAISKVVLNLFSKHSKDWFTLYRHRRQLDEEQVEKIQRMDPEKELVGQLPHLFAKDLNTAMLLQDRLERVVLFFDTHEAFWGTERRDLAGDQYFKEDEWLRRLLKTLEFSAGVVVVVAGRDRPRWAEASRAKIPDKFLDAQLIGHLSEVDAALYLGRAGVGEEAMRRALIGYARVAPNQIHPFYLGLCVDILIAAAEKGTKLKPEDFRGVPQAADKEKELLDRLLRYVDEDVHYAIRALSACRAFDRELYLKLGEALSFYATEPSFRVLTRFSFVWRTEHRGEGWYRIHDLLRRLLRERSDEAVKRSDAVLEKHYRERGEAVGVANVVEAIYHANRVEPERGVEEWAMVFNKAQESGRYSVCRALLELRSELLIQTDSGRGIVLISEGLYHIGLSGYDEARKELIEALAALNVALGLKPDLAFIHNNKGLALQGLGTVQAHLSRHAEAASYYEQAIASFDVALSRESDFAPSHSNKGLTLKSLGEVQMYLSQYDQATENYKQALSSLDAALRFIPNESDVYSNKGLTLQSLGYAQALQAHYEEAELSYEEAISSFDTAIRLAPDRTLAHASKGSVLQSLGEMQIQLARYERAIASYEESITSFDAALRLAPDFALAHASKGAALRSLGDVHALLSQHEEAVTNYRRALGSLDASLLLAPDVAFTHVNKGLTLRGLGMSHHLKSNYEEAAANCKEALTHFESALRLAPDLTLTHNNKGLTLRNLGDAQVQLEDYEAAIASYEDALLSFDSALRLAPDLVLAHANQAFALRGMGQAQAHLSQLEDAVETLKKAIAAADSAIRLAPDLADAHSARGVSLLWLGIVEADLEQRESAMKNWQAALEAFSSSLEIAEGNSWTQQLKDFTRELMEDSSET
ncbi:MAG TPA: hypothetical protein VJT09_09260 [Pyrinomonadaceae bacterium]|nr:hypothetical protein [Pyrinomonadaceae bacterium]